MLPRHLEEHYRTITQGVASRRPHDSYQKIFSMLYEFYGPETLFEYLNTSIRDISCIRLLKKKHSYQKRAGFTCKNLVLGHFEKIRTLNHEDFSDNIKKSLGFDPVFDYLLGQYTPFRANEHFVGDYVVTDRFGKIILIIQTKNTIMAMEPNFISKIESEFDRAKNLSAKYCLLLAWPEDDSDAIDMINEQMPYKEFTHAYNRWKGIPSGAFICSKIRMPSHVFLAPRHDQFDPISLFRERILRIVNAVTYRCNALK